MITLADFMGGGEGKAPALDFTMHLGNGRVNSYRPSTGGIVATLVDPSKDVFRTAGFPYFVVINDASAEKNLVVKNHSGNTVLDIAGGEVGMFGIRLTSTGTRVWIGELYTRLT